MSLRPHLYSCSYRKCLQGGSTFSFPTEIPRSTGALDTVVFKGCRFFWNVPHLGAHCFSPLRLHSLPKQIQSPAKTSRRGVLSYLGGGTLRRQWPVGTAVLGVREARRLSKVHHPLRALGVAELQGPTWRAHLEVGVPCTEDQAPQIQVGLVCWRLPQSPPLHHTPALGSKALQAPGM